MTTTMKHLIERQTTVYDIERDDSTPCRSVLRRTTFREKNQEATPIVLACLALLTLWGCTSQAGARDDCGYLADAGSSCFLPPVRRDDGDRIGDAPSESGDSANMGETDTRRPCVPACEGKQCGHDGCGGHCGVCDDGNLCNGLEICIEGVCMSGEPLSCLDDSPCTADECDPDLGCRHVYEPDACEAGTVCYQGQCVDHAQVRQLVAAGAGHSCVVVESGDVWCWGDNSHGQVGAVASGNAEPPTLVGGLPSKAVSVSCGWYHTCALLETGELYCWGSDSQGQLGSIEVSHFSACPLVVESTEKWLFVSAGSVHTCAVSESGGVWCWGLGDDGQIGYGNDTMNVGIPTAAAMEEQAVSVVAGTEHTCALDGKGDIWCWGSFVCGATEEGSGSLPCGHKPTLMTGVSGAYAVDSGTEHVCAVVATGLVCWGQNIRGQLGNGTFSDWGVYSPPAEVDLSDMTSSLLTVGLGDRHSCVIGKDGSLWYWGAVYVSPYPETADMAVVPFHVEGIDEVVAVSGGTFHTCALRSDGSVYCWGLNDQGQLGLPPSGEPVLVPIEVPGLP